MGPFLCCNADESLSTIQRSLSLKYIEWAPVQNPDYSGILLYFGLLFANVQKSCCKHAELFNLVFGFKLFFFSLFYVIQIDEVHNLRIASNIKVVAVHCGSVSIGRQTTFRMSGALTTGHDVRYFSLNPQ